MVGVAIVRQMPQPFCKAFEKSNIMCLITSERFAPHFTHYRGTKHKLSAGTRFYVSTGWNSYSYTKLDNGQSVTCKAQYLNYRSQSQKQDAFSRERTSIEIYGYLKYIFKEYQHFL